MATVTPPLQARQTFVQPLQPTARTANPRLRNPSTALPHIDTPAFCINDARPVSGVFGNQQPSRPQQQHQLAMPSRAGSSKELTNAAVGRAGTAMNGNGKRAAIDVVDLTLTTGEALATSSVPRVKRARKVIDGGPPTAPKRKARNGRERAEQHEKMTAESVTWRQKYRKAFPAFVFYLDALEASAETSITKAVERLGASVDPFFSRKVTHIITSRAIPVAGATANGPGGNKENCPSGSAACPPPPPKANGFISTLTATNAFVESTAGPARTRKQPARQSPVSYSMQDGQRLRQFGGEGLEKNPFIVEPKEQKDILIRASEFGLKIWHLEKAQRIITRINSYSPSKPSPPALRTLSLPSLLRDERLFGTRERDPFVPRPDTYYFPPKSAYVLVEDSTGEHRPVVVKEYTRPRRGEDPSWPVLWGGVEGRGAFYHYDGPPVVYESRVRPPVPARAPQPGYAVAAARAVALTTAGNGNGNGGAPSLRRSMSLNQFRKHQTGLAKDHDDAAGLGGATTKLASVAPYLAASGNSQIITSNVASGTSTRSGAPQHARLNGALVDKRLAILSRSTVTSMGGPMRLGGGGIPAPGKLKRSTSVDAGLNARVPPPREEPKKPGYCENCRIKYDDFKEHIISRKHRKFARNPANWVELDELLDKIERPLLDDDEGSSPDAFAGEGDSGYFEQDMMEGCESCGSDEQNEEEDEDEDEDEEEEEFDEEDEGEGSVEEE